MPPATTSHQKPRQIETASPSRGRPPQGLPSFVCAPRRPEGSNPPAGARLGGSPARPGAIDSRWLARGTKGMKLLDVHDILLEAKSMSFAIVDLQSPHTAGCGNAGPLKIDKGRHPNMDYLDK